MADRDLVLVLGMGRSGTSALTRVLSLSGCTLPDSVLGATDFNSRGSWEPTALRRLNNSFMLSHGTRALDPTVRLQETTFDDHERENYLRQIQTFLAECPEGPALIIKAPHVTELFDFWLEAARRAGFSVKVVIPIRHPREVHASLAARKPISMELVNAYWIKTSLLSERRSRDLPRVFVAYSNLLSDWQTEVARVSKALSLDLLADELAVNAFLSRDLRQQKYSGPVIETFGYSWTTRVYAELSAAAQDEPIYFPTLDEIYHAFCKSERTFRTAWDEFRTAFDATDAEQILNRIDKEPVWQSGRDY